MAALPPGRDAPKTDGSCFNCGSHDHFAMNCPEPLRQEPHGAAMIRQRNANNNLHGNGGRSLDNAKPKGGSIVVTKYANPVPPPFYPPPAANAWGPPPLPIPPPPPPQYGQQPLPPYPPPHQAQQPYPLPPYLPVNNGYGPSPPFAPYSQPPYQPPPPPPSYGPPASYGPPSYPQAPQPSYQGTPAPVYHGPPPSFTGPPAPRLQVPPPPRYYGHVVPPPPLPQSAYPSGYRAPPPPGPPPPPGIYPPSHYAPNPQPTAPYANAYPPPPNPNRQMDSGSHVHQRHHRSRRGDKGIKTRYLRRDNDNNQRGRNPRDSVSSQRQASCSRQPSPKPSPVATDVAMQTPKSKDAETEDVKPDVAKTETPGTREGAVEEEDQFDPDTLWDFEKAFLELDIKPADPVGKPLAAEWSDDPTIPPAYNAKCIKTEYYDPDNPDAFLASVRDTKYWPEVKRDPVFRFRRHMVVVQFPGSHHEYFTYHFSRRIGPKELKEREVLPMPSDTTLIERPCHSSTAHQRHGDMSSVLLNGKRTMPEADDYSRDVKRPRTHELDRSPVPRPSHRPSSRDVDLDANPWVPQAGESRLDSPRRPYSREDFTHSPGGYRLQPNGRLAPYDSAQRHDSGYQSSTDRYRSIRDEKGTKYRTSPPAARARERDAHREGGRYRDQSRDQDLSRAGHRGRARTRSRSRSPSRSPSCSRSRTPANDSPSRPDSEEDLDDLDYELIGMQRPASPAKKILSRPLMGKPRVKVDGAFSRRW